MDSILSETVEQLRPDVTLIIKGRGIAPTTVCRVRRHGRIAIYYPDNPYWCASDRNDSLARLCAADLAVVWSARLRDRLAPDCHRVGLVPFGYDDRWFPPADNGLPRRGVVFMGTWSPRRERYLAALAGLQLTIFGTGWHRARQLQTAVPAYEDEAGMLLRQAAIGINIFHPHNAGAHNMRTRELAASGALQLTDPGIDGTPLRETETVADGSPRPRISDSLSSTTPRIRLPPRR